jgi:pimeloyl-ACP methyl ester carboxylesterase
MRYNVFFALGLQLISLFILTESCGKNNIGEGYSLTAIKINKDSVVLKVGETEQLTAAAIPAVANQPRYVWLSSDNNTATVTNGLVTAISVGQATISASHDGIRSIIPVRVSTSDVLHSYGDTVLRMTLTGADCPFATKAAYGVYIPTRTEPLRGVLIIQHGCGMEQFGITKAYDLQYQAFARKWNLAVIETALYGNCGGWRDPESGSATALLKILQEAGKASAHPELNTVPWLLWGHSGGGYWVLGMVKNYPERVMAAVCYSPAFDPQWNYPPAAAKVPILTRHAGINDANGDGVLCQATSINAFGKLRAMDAPISIALNESQNHNLSYIRYISIPFYEAVMKQRMPPTGAAEMLGLDRNQTWLGDTTSQQLFKESGYTGNKNGMCVFPDEATAKNWQEYVSTGTLKDKTAPAAPFNLTVGKAGNDIEISWAADADIESGILRFDIYKDGVLVGKLPETGAYQGFDTNGDNTIPVQVPAMKFRIAGAAGSDATIGVTTVNHFNLVSERKTINYKR